MKITGAEAEIYIPIIMNQDVPTLSMTARPIGSVKMRHNMSKKSERTWTDSTTMDKAIIKAMQHQLAFIRIEHMTSLNVISIHGMRMLGEADISHN